MTIFLFRWKIKPGKEKQYEKNWSIVTKAILDECGSYGSRLHIAEKSGGISAATKTMIQLLTTDHLDDQMAALTWLKEQSFVQKIG